jgi:nitrate reductase cytochrome c-type subunit
MNNEITIAIISAGASILASIITLIGVLSNQKQANNKIIHQFETTQAINSTKIEELTREVREHNNFARRMPVVEEKIEDLKTTTNELKKYHMQ